MRVIGTESGSRWKRGKGRVAKNKRWKTENQFSFLLASSLTFPSTKSSAKDLLFVGTPLGRDMISCLTWRLLPLTIAFSGSQPRPQGLLLDDWQSSRRRPWGRGWWSPERTWLPLWQLSALESGMEFFNPLKVGISYVTFARKCKLSIMR